MKRLMIMTIMLLTVMHTASTVNASTISPEELTDVNASTISPEELTENQFLLDGTLFSGHIKMADLLADGWELDEKDVGKEYEPRDYEDSINTWSVPMTKGDLKIDVSPYNESTEVPCTIEDTEILMVIVEEAADVPFFVENGISFDSTTDTIKKIYGDDFEIDERDGFDYYKVPKMNTRITFYVEDGKDVTRIKLWIPRS